MDALIGLLRGMESALLAYSGGVDSTFLLKAVNLSGIKGLAVTANSGTMPEDDLENAVSMASMTGVPHRVIKTSELENEDFLANTPRRCFHCKNELFEKLKGIAQGEGLRFVMDGSNMDDLDDTRPGMEAGRLHRVRSPLIEAGFTKEEIREASRLLGLPTWDRHASPCLASRFPHGVRITPEALKTVASAEKALGEMGFGGPLRVRHHGDTARIVLSAGEIKRMLSPEIRGLVVGKLLALGYKFVSLDLEGYKSGKMAGSARFLNKE